MRGFFFFFGMNAAIQHQMMGSTREMLDSSFIYQDSLRYKLVEFVKSVKHEPDFSYSMNI